MAAKKPDFTITETGLEASPTGMQRLLNTSHVTVSKIQKAGHLEKIGAGTYDVIKSMMLYHSYLQGKAESGDIDYQEEKARLTKMQADKVEMDVLERAGELVEVAEVVEEWQSQLMDMKGKLLAIPSKLATLVTDMDNTAEIQELIDTYVREALEELQEYEGNRGHKGKPKRGKGSSKATTEADDL